MKVSLWAEIRRLHEIERLSKRAIAGRLRCCHTTVTKALAMQEPPSQVARPPRTSKLDPYKKQIDELIDRYPRLSAVRVLEEISKGEDGYPGRITLVKDYLRTIRPARGRVYHEVLYEPGEAFQVDWGTCGRLQAHRIKPGDLRQHLVVGRQGVILVYLGGAVGALAFQARQRYGYRPFALGLLAGATVLVGKFALDSDPAMYVGIAMLVGASLWNAWPQLKRIPSCQEQEPSKCSARVAPRAQRRSTS